jgi:hypothetical protein
LAVKIGGSLLFILFLPFDFYETLSLKLCSLIIALAFY